MPSIERVIAELESLAPLRLAAEWDTVGLLVGSRRPAIERLMTCLTLTPTVAREAVREAADMVVSHHPLPFRPVGRITDATPTGSVLLELIGGGVAVWSSHTAWDSAAGGINDQLASLIGLDHVAPLEPDAIHPLAGFGRAGSAPVGWTVAHLARHLAESLAVGGVQVVGNLARPAGRVGIICGSGGDSLDAVLQAGCETLVTGELKLHAALDADSRGLAVVAVGHHASERFAMERLATRLAESLPGLHAWASRDETDPVASLPNSSPR